MSLVKTRDTYSKLSSAPIPPPPLQEYVMEGAGLWMEGVVSNFLLTHCESLQHIVWRFNVEGICELSLNEHSVHVFTYVIDLNFSRVLS